MKTKRADSHHQCIVCAAPEQNPASLDLLFTQMRAQQVQARFMVDQRYQGYQGVLHGGIAATLLDAAMTQCLVAQGIEAMTASLDVRFHMPIAIGSRLTVIGRQLAQKRNIYLMEAELVANGLCYASAKAKFMLPKQPKVAP
ncbi:PaaI family thioesterase [Shewanella avicenniae]|uniref:Acyl-coenzyme A thioesterase THEM4 n=1 Tax=Shewanella avicenniae TaxID=2814294 RepID=A0ABX7QPK0_9GAMM|nr:PaaI family thioesterase [Shewanella avicenniae]QSX33199.1 PaaI family thioesterase [Shewanella avicenniae]